MRRLGFLAAAILVFLTFTVPFKASAATVTEFEGVTEPTEKALEWKVGLGVAAVPDYEGSGDYEAAPIPQLSVVSKSGWSVEWLGNLVRANVLPSKTWRFGPMLRYRLERDEVKNDKVDKMKKVDAAVELGAYAGVEINNWIFRVDVAQDVSDAHDGFLASAAIGYTWNVNPWKFTLMGMTSYADEDYMSTYFSVSADDSADSGLRRYEADSGFKDVGAQLMIGYKLTENWGITGALRYTRLLGDAADSPLVEDEGNENQLLLGLLVSYSF